jgi:hypothetical protein
MSSAVIWTMIRFTSVPLTAISSPPARVDRVDIDREVC